jgi:DeoR/GlpR family transcriptional regulator of sugar metabolism
MELSFLERKQKILQILEQDGLVKIDQLAPLLSVSEITIRRDLERLAREGLLIKKRGGAARREPSVSELFFEKRIKEMEAEKRRIGQAAAAMVQRGDVVLLDTGTTTMQIARALKTVSGITIITNSMLILAELAYAKDLNLILLGGTYRMGDFALSGPLTEKNLEMFRARLAFLGADGISAAIGVTSNDIYTAEVTKSMMAHAETAVLVADHSKVGRVGAIKYAEAKDFGLLITDKELPAGEQEALEKIGLKIESV